MEEMKSHTTLGYQVLLSATKELKNDPMVVVAANIAKLIMKMGWIWLSRRVKRREYSS